MPNISFENGVHACYNEAVLKRKIKNTEVAVMCSSIWNYICQCLNGCGFSCCGFHCGG